MNLDLENVELVDAYENHLIDDHTKNVDDFFEEMTKQAALNVEENRQTIVELNRTKNEENQNSSGKKRVVALNIFVWILFAAGILVAGLFFNKAFNADFLGFDLPQYLSIIIGVIGIIVSITTITLSLTIIRKKINEYNFIIDKLNKSIQELNDKADLQMAPLNNLFNWNQPMKILEKTIPLIKLDDHFNPGRWDFLRQKYELEDIKGNENITFVQSGEIKGNPFLFVEKIAQSMFLKTYTGSITIHWTETYKDSDGKTKTRTKSQILTASLDAKAPQYKKNHYVIYGNEAAPNLTFSRIPTNAPYSNEKDLENYIESKTKSLERKARKAIKKEETFNMLSNNEFEVLYGATNRNNEIEFRLLFTPVAQRQIIKLFKSSKGYGDYFDYEKRKKINYIYPHPLEIKNLETNVENFKTNDYDTTKKIFEQFNYQYFDSILFSLLPALCIPLYQQLKPAEYIYEQDYGQVSSPWEYEVLARKQNVSLLKHPKATTTNIFKTKVLQHHNHIDQVLVKASAFEGVNRVTTFQVWGGDGKFHTVPVHWVEYLPVEQTTPMIVQQTQNYDLNKFQAQKKTDAWSAYFNQQQVQNSDIIFHRNLVSFVNKTEAFDYQGLENLIKGEE